MKLVGEDLVHLATGAAFLGAGGGGDPYLGRLLARAAIDEFGAPELCHPDEVSDSARVMTIAMLGAPTIILEKGLAGEEVDIAIRRLEEHLGETADYLMPLEIGGINSLVPVMAAARLGLPLIDADGMGRAFPELQMTTFNAHGISTTPLALADDHGTWLLLEAPDAGSVEGMIRTVAVALGCSAVVCSYPMTGREVKECAVHGTLSVARDVGRAIDSGSDFADPVQALMDHLRGTAYYTQCRLLFDGRVVDVRREVEGGFSIGHLRLAHSEDRDRSMEIVFQNEFLVAREGERLRAVVPDLVCLVERETAQPVLADTVRYGQRLKVLGVSAPPVMRSKESLSIFGPQAFGLDEAFVPLELLADS